jgi:hypothetical protein
MHRAFFPFFRAQALPLASRGGGRDFQWSRAWIA